MGGRTVSGDNVTDDIIERYGLNGHDAGLRLIDPREFIGQPVPEREWIVPDWVPVGVTTALYGPGGTGKSLLAQQLMTAAAVGGNWVGIPVEPVPSLGVFCEDDVDELRRRQHSINRELFGCDLDALGDARWLPRLGKDNVLMTFTRDGRGAPTPLLGLIEEAARDFGAKLIIIDTIADTFGGDQNNAGQVRQYVQFGLARLARAIGGAVVACAHPSRSGISSNSGESGSVQWDAAFRSRLYLSAPKKEDKDDPEPDPDARILSRKKANYAQRDETVSLYWESGVLKSDAPSERAARPPAEDVFMTILDNVTREHQTLSPNLRASNYAPRLFEKRPERKGYRQRDFENAMQLLLSMREIVIEEYGRGTQLKDRIVRAMPLPF
jgi:RecA-family ATPase